MDKISRILPNSSRTSSVDFAKERPVRPGTPGFGRPDGRADIRDRVTLSSIAKASAPQELSTYRNTRDSQRAAVVERIANDFFNTKAAAAPPPEPIIAEPTYEPSITPSDEGVESEETSLQELLQPLEESEVGMTPIELRRQINFRPLAVDRS